MSGPLKGMRVLELAQIMAGPTCGMMLADMGADVVKVEKLPGGDDARGYREPRINGESAPFLILNRNKRGLALDLKNPQGKAVLKRMAARADVIVENYRPGTMEKLGLGYEVLREINPGLIYCAITGFGRNGPDAGRGGFDLIAQGFSGLMSITGEPGRPPAKTGNSVADTNAGILAALGIVAAYVHKLRTGEGQLVDTSLMEAAVQQTYWHAAVFFATGVSPGPTGSSHILTAPYQAFPTADGWINVGGANQSNWERICDTVGHPEWKTAAEYATSSDRTRNRAALAEAISEVLRTKPSAHWIAEFDRAGVPVGPIHTVGEALEHPQTLARGMVVEVDHARAGRVRAIGTPVKFSRTPTEITRGAPLLGQHTREVLGEYGFAADEIEALFAAGAVS